MDINYIAVLPEIILAVVGIVLMVLIPSIPREKQAGLGYLALLGTALATVAAVSQWDTQGLPTFFQMVFLDNFAHFAKILFLVAIGAVIAISISYLEKDRLFRAEYFSLLLFAAVGMCLMASSADLIMTFLGIEILSIATYVLAGYRRDEMKSVESALKYFILGAFSTAFLLYGIAFIYGATGTTKYLGIAAALERGSGIPYFIVIGLGLILVGFGFKAALAPFHIWAPDVYQGAPIPIMAHLAVGSKAAALIAFLRILYQVLPGMINDWQGLLWISAVVTMAVGNIAALTQTNIKRLLAYSSIAHAGYLLVGFTAASTEGARGVLFYLAAYAFMNIGALTVVQLVARRDEKYVELEDYAGLGYRSPGLALALSVFLVSLAGIPLTAGFTGKLFVFAAAIESGAYGLVVIAVLASAVGVYYYIRVLVYMYMRGPAEAEGESIGLPAIPGLVLAVMVLGTLFLGILPGGLLQIADQAVQVLNEVSRF